MASKGADESAGDIHRVPSLTSSLSRSSSAGEIDEVARIILDDPSFKAQTRTAMGYDFRSGDAKERFIEFLREKEESPSSPMPSKVFSSPESSRSRGSLLDTRVPSCSAAQKDEAADDAERAPLSLLKDPDLRFPLLSASLSPLSYAAEVDAIAAKIIPGYNTKYRTQTLGFDFRRRGEKQRFVDELRTMEREMIRESILKGGAPKSKSDSELFVQLLMLSEDSFISEIEAVARGLLDPEFDDETAEEMGYDFELEDDITKFIRLLKRTAHERWVVGKPLKITDEEARSAKSTPIKRSEDWATTAHPTEHRCHFQAEVGSLFAANIARRKLRGLNRHLTKPDSTRYTFLEAFDVAALGPLSHLRHQALQVHDSFTKGERGIVFFPGEHPDTRAPRDPIPIDELSNLDHGRALAFYTLEFSPEDPTEHGCDCQELSFYRIVNSKLHSYDAEEEATVMELEPLLPLIALLVEAVQEAPKAELKLRQKFVAHADEETDGGLAVKAELFRGISGRPIFGYGTKDERPMQLEDQIIWMSFTSTSLRKKRAEKFMKRDHRTDSSGKKPGTLFCIHGVNPEFSARMEDVSVYPEESEVVLMPGMRFRVVSVAEMPAGSGFYVVELVAGKQMGTDAIKPFKPLVSLK